MRCPCLGRQRDHQLWSRRICRWGRRPCRCGSDPSSGRIASRGCRQTAATAGRSSCRGRSYLYCAIGRRHSRATPAARHREHRRDTSLGRWSLRARIDELAPARCCWGPRLATLDSMRLSAACDCQAELRGVSTPVRSSRMRNPHAARSRRSCRRRRQTRPSPQADRLAGRVSSPRRTHHAEIRSETIR